MSSHSERLLIEVIGADIAPAELPRSGMLAIGSSPERAGLVLTDQGVAEVHCAIGRTKDGSYAVKDLGSEYGTLLNGTKVTQARLKAGDEIILGSARLAVVGSLQGAPEKPTKAPGQPAMVQPTLVKATPKRKPSPAPKIAGYKVQQLLGKGAMGEVYLAVQISLDREVALKVLSKKHEADQAFVASFQAEARAAAALNHPNVVTVHDVGQQDGVHYLTMEYMDRSCLEDRVTREGALPWTLVLQVLKDAAAGLVYAESRGIVHRDIKPANLMQNQASTTKIADLGLATSISQEENPDGENKIFGTPHFIAPEQIKGQKADCRSDLYSLGSTAYRLLTGHTPFEGKNTREILRAKLKGQFTPILERAPDAPEGLVKVVDRLMALEPGDRYPSATALVRELERLGETGNGGEAQEASAGSGWLKIAVPGFLLGLAAVAFVMFSNPDSATEDGENRTAGTLQDAPTQGNNTAEAQPPSGAASERESEQALATEESPHAEDNDIKEQLFEREAENAYLRLGQQDITPTERRDALRELALNFIGTTTASQASEEANALEQEIKTRTVQDLERNTAVKAMLARLNRLANLDSELLLPGQILTSLASAAGLKGFADDPAFQRQYEKLRQAVVARSLEQFVEAQIAIDELQAAGKFEAAAVAMNELLARTVLPTLEENNRPPRLGEIEGLADQLRGRIANLDAFEVDFQNRVQAQDELLALKAFGANSGLLAEISALNLDAAVARTQALRKEMRDPQVIADFDQFASVLVSASKALPILWNNPQWRRKSVPDPTEKRPGSHEVLEVTRSGLTIESGAGSKTLAWSDFARQTKSLRKLFSKRLRRDYTADESQAIASLLHLAAVAESYSMMADSLAAQGATGFSVSQLDDLEVPFENVLDTFKDPDMLAALERERQACTLLGQALVHADERAWSTAVSELEQLRVDFSSTWLVRLISDGSMPE